MESKRNMREMALVVLHVIPFIYLLLVFTSLPAEVPTHFNIHGEADDYSNKYSLWWMLALLNGIGYFIFLLIPRIDPKKFATSNPKIYFKIRVGMSILFVALSLLIIHMAAGHTLSGLLMLSIMFAALCMFLGNYLQAVRTNYFIGIRTPWTLHSDDVWRRTHRLTGRVLFFGGLISLPLIFVVPFNLSPVAPVAVLIAGCLLGVVYSFILFKSTKSSTRSS
jgi:uncharacterized membrane protein